jgi:hypothetical protein
MSPYRMSPAAAALLISFVLASLGERVENAQAPPRQPTPNDTLVSPEIATDRRVTFRIYAPKASAVTLRGDWMEGAGTTALTKDDVGV